MVLLNNTMPCPMCADTGYYDDEECLYCGIQASAISLDNANNIIIYT